jgi:ankyrin repeat protein
MHGYVQSGRAPLNWACYKGHMEVVKLLLAHVDVDINKANNVRGRGGAGRERVHGGQRSWVHAGEAAEGGSPHTL